MWRLPWLIFLHWKWRHPKLYNLYQAIRILVRITSFGIRASALVTGSILSNFYFFPLSFVSQFRVCVLFRSCLHLVSFLFASLLRSCCVLVCILVCVLVFVLILILVLVSFRFCVNFFLNSVSNFVWDYLAYWKNFGGLGCSRPFNFSYLFVWLLNELPNCLLNLD